MGLEKMDSEKIGLGQIGLGKNGLDHNGLYKTYCTRTKWGWIRKKIRTKSTHPDYDTSMVLTCGSFRMVGVDGSLPTVLSVLQIGSGANVTYITILGTIRQNLWQFWPLFSIIFIRR
jgi:hypothetical protein